MRTHFVFRSLELLVQKLGSKRLLSQKYCKLLSFNTNLGNLHRYIFRHCITSCSVKALSQNAIFHATLRAIVSISCGLPLQHCTQYVVFGSEKIYIFYFMLFIFLRNLKGQISPWNWSSFFWTPARKLTAELPVGWRNNNIYYEYSFLNQTLFYTILINYLPL